MVNCIESRGDKSRTVKSYHQEQRERRQQLSRRQFRCQDRVDNLTEKKHLKDYANLSDLQYEAE